MGIISGLFWHPDKFVFPVAVTAVASGFCLSLFYNNRQSNIVFGITLNLSLFFFGLFLYNQEKSSLSALDPEQTTVLCVLKEYPEEKLNSYMLTVRLEQEVEGSAARDLKGSMVIYMRKGEIAPSFIPGDRLLAICTPQPIISRGNPNEFNYRFYMENQGIKYFAFARESDIMLHSVPGRRNLMHLAQITRHGITDLYRKLGIEGEELAVVAAVTLGEKNLLDPDQKENFIKAGVVHIMAVSGLHAMILSLFVFNILFFLKRRFNTLRVIITIIILWAFAFVTGLAPSVQRASLMFTFLHAGKLMQRQVNSINSVLASAFVLIIIRPSVIFSAGFLLSYSAVIFIICFYNDLYVRLQPRNLILDFFWKSAVVTLVAQAGTMALTITLFNRFPVLFIVTNILIVPLATVIIVTGLLTLLAVPVAFISKALAFILVKATWLTNTITEKAASLPFSSIEQIGMTPAECLLLFCFIFLSMWFILKKGSIMIHIPLALLLLFVTAGTIRRISLRTTNELIVYNTTGAPATAIRTGRTLTLYTDTIPGKNEVIRHASALGLRINTRVPGERALAVKQGEKSILICNLLNNSVLRNISPDIIVLSGTYPRIGRSLSFGKPPEAVIITSEASAGYSLPDYFPSQLIDTIHYVRRSGAFRMRLP